MLPQFLLDILNPIHYQESLRAVENNRLLQSRGRAEPSRSLSKLSWALFVALLIALLISRLAATAQTTTGAPEATYTVHLPLVMKPEPLPPSETLIDQALAQGEIDAETALIYKVYAAFGDGRLPVRYRGDDSGIIDSLIMGEVAGRFNRLPPAAQATLAPFVIPPFQAGSWWDLRDRAPAEFTPTDAEYRCGENGAPLLEKWSFVLTQNGEAKVWWQQRYPGDAAKARAIADALDTPIWLKLTGLMERKPLPDDGSFIPCRGGDDRLDISITDLDKDKNGLTIPYGCKAAPVHILIRRDAELSTVVHELMHAIQFSYDVADSCMNSPNNAWWAEASATWATDYVYPSMNNEHDFASDFLDEPWLPLETYAPLGSHKAPRQYGAYLWPFFLDRSLGKPEIVRTVWQYLTQYDDSLEAINAAIPGGFKTQWPLFARANWNKHSVDYYRQWDGLLWGAKTIGTSPDRASNVRIPVNLAGEPGFEFTLNADVKHLAAHYYHFYFNDDNARSIAFRNPTSLSQHWPTARVQALVKIKDQAWLPPQDWTELSGHAFCRDMRAERIEELVIISNSEWQDREHVLDPFDDPVLVATNIGCWRWKGTTTSVVENGDWVATIKTDDVIFERHRYPESPEGPLFSEDYYALREGFWGWELTDGPSECTYTGGPVYVPVASLPPNGFIGDLTVANYNTSATQRPYSGSGVGGLPGGSYTWHCPNGNTGTLPFPGSAWLLAGTTDVSVSADGRTMRGTATAYRPQQTITYTWNFTALREP